MYPGIYSLLHILQAEGIYLLTSVPTGETSDVEAPQANNFRKAPEYPGLKGQMEEMVLGSGPPSGNGDYAGGPRRGSWEHGGGLELMLVV